LAEPQKIRTFLWYEGQAEEAVNHYMKAFKDSRITSVTYYGEGMPLPAGTAMTVEFELAGQQYIALNAGPMFQFTEAISLFVSADDQAEVDRLWDHLTSDGGKESMCGWLKDKYGLSWQIIPRRFMDIMRDGTPAQQGRVMAAMMKMKKFDLAAIEAAAKG
jgi:predicted 3-demethylubiquinone-9 3-methyltransferase (glyoxalase superfamily)